jgi:hypothetical protein
MIVLKKGQILAKRYYVLGLLAEGSFGSIYYARDMTRVEIDPEKHVAIKVEKSAGGEKKYIFI